MNDTIVGMSTPTSTTSDIFRCPNEVLLQILQYVDPLSWQSFSLVSRRCHLVAHDRNLWKTYCCSLKYWQNDNWRECVQNDTPDVNWKYMGQFRANTTEFVRHKFETLMLAGPDYHHILAEIGSRGYDAKDYLMEQRKVPDDDPQVLCRRFYAQEALNAVHRGRVIGAWADAMLSGPPSRRTQLMKGYTKYRLERLLCDVGLAVLEQTDDGIESLSTTLDKWIEVFLEDHPGCMDQPIPERALALHSRFYELVNVRSSDPRIPFLGYAPFGQRVEVLRSSAEGAAPLFFSAVLLALAQRLDIPACLGDGGETVLVPYDNSQGSRCTQSRGKVIFLWPGDTTEIGPVLFQDIMVESEDVFVFNLLRFLYGHNGNEQFYVLDEFAYQIGVVSPHLQACGKVLLVQHLLYTIESMAWCWGRGVILSYQPSDAWVVEGYVQKGLETQPFLAHNAEMRRESEHLMLSLRNWKRQLMYEPREPGCVTECVARCNGAGCPRCPRFRIGDVVNITSNFEGHLRPLPETESAGIGIVVGRCGFTDRNYTYQYYCLCPSIRIPRRDFNSAYKSFHYKIVKCYDEHGLSPIYDPSFISLDILFYAGAYFQRFDVGHCRFVSNLKNIYPHD